MQSRYFPYETACRTFAKMARSLKCTSECNLTDSLVDLRMRVMLRRSLSTGLTKRAAGLACEQPPSPDPTSAPLTRAVVSNSATWLSHCASASFGVHRSPADSRATAEMTAIPSIMGEEASLIARDDECVARPHSEIILTSGSTNDTVIAGVTESNRNKTHISPLNVCDASDLTGVIPVDGQFDTSVQLPMHAEKIKNNSLIEDTNVSDDVVHIKDSNYQGVLDSHTKVLESATGLNVALTAKPSDISSEPIKSSTAQGALVTTTSHGAFQAVQNEVEEPPSVLCRCTAFNETCGNGLIDRSGSTDPELRRPASGLLQPPAAASAVSLQYRAATVCAASVAVALILVVMRRLSLMLHGA
ncbi:unnamed protein product [Dicrocoelium dendriticum]|nr:unnamed protein product [Dicrocoelium dendriticum]